MNLTYLTLEMRRVLRDRAGFIFTIGIPVFMYLIFGAATSYKDQPAGHGNVATYVLVSMAAYGAVTATAGMGGSAAVERSLGWGRQLGLTPLTDGGYVRVKTAVAVFVAAFPIAAIYLTGALTGCRADWQVWVLCPLLTIVGAALFTLWGMLWGLLLRSESASSVAGGSLVVLGFLGNVFMPLSGPLLSFARFTPLYGLVQLVRHPLTEGRVMDGTRLVAESLWVPVANVAAWLLVLACTTTLLVRRSRGRQ